jgi:hypothetical protein
MALAWKIDECTAAGNRMRLRGWCLGDRSPIKAVELAFSGTRNRVRLASFGLPSPDIAAEKGPGAGLCRFDEWVDVPPGPGVPDFALQFILADGTIALGSRAPEMGGPAGTARGEAELRAELEALAKREAAFKAGIAAEFLDRGEGSTYLHTLREDIAELRRRGQAASAELESLVRRLESEEKRVAVLEEELRRLSR